MSDSTTPSGDIDTNSFQRAMLQYRNTSDRDTKLSSAKCVFGHLIRDFIPIQPGRYKPHPTWTETLLVREEALRNRHMREAECWTEHTKRLPPLVVGNHVRIQNQTGPSTLEWDKSGVLIKVRQFDLYVIRVEGSGRVTLRNKKFLRKYLPVISPPPTQTIKNDLSSRTLNTPQQEPLCTKETPKSERNTENPKPTPGEDPTSPPLVLQESPLPPPPRLSTPPNNTTPNVRNTYVDQDPMAIRKAVTLVN